MTDGPPRRPTDPENPSDAAPIEVPGEATRKAGFADASRPPDSCSAQHDPLELLVVRPTLGQGGADRVTCTLLAHLDRSRFRPKLALFHRRGEWLADIPGDVETIDLGGRSLWSAWLPLARLISASKPAIVLSTSGGANVAASLAHFAARSQARLVLSERNMLIQGRPGIKRAILLLAKALLYRRADLITAVSGEVARDVVSRLRLRPEAVRVVHNPMTRAESQSLDPVPAPHPWFDDEPPVLLAAGRLIPPKDFATLLWAFSLVHRKLLSRLVVLGDGPESGRLARLARRLDIEDDVAFLGFRKDIRTFMARCTVFVSSSRVEGLPGVLIQAMDCGAPVVSTRCPGAAEAIGAESNGILVPVGDPQGLADAIIELLTDEERRRELADRGRRSSARFRTEKIMPLYEAALLGDPRCQT